MKKLFKRKKKKKIGEKKLLNTKTCDLEDYQFAGKFRYESFFFEFFFVHSFVVFDSLAFFFIFFCVVRVCFVFQWFAEMRYKSRISLFIPLFEGSKKIAQKTPFSHWIMWKKTNERINPMTSHRIWKWSKAG